jgi:uncharacterized protein (TIGR00303 family)
LRGLTTYGNDYFAYDLKGKKPLFICTIATTATARIPDITGAGASPELMEFTPAGDVELIIHGELRCCEIPPQTVFEGDSAPTPAMLTKAALELTDIPFLIANAGSIVTPDVPFVLLGDEPGEDIQTGEAVKNPDKIFEKSLELGKEMSKVCDYLLLGESLPAGTTTALGVLTALGYDAEFKVSGSSPENPHNLKKDIVFKGIGKSGIEVGEFTPFEAVEVVGDPMIPAVAGMVVGSNVPVVLAGGTQMAGVCGFIKKLVPDFDFSRVCLATTVFVAKDKTADLFNLIEQIGDIAINIVDPEFEKSSNGGLKNYLKGFVKEGVGAGGAMYTALLLGYSIDEIRAKIEEVCK